MRTGILGAGLCVLALSVVISCGRHEQPGTNARNVVDAAREKPARLPVGTRPSAFLPDVPDASDALDGVGTNETPPRYTITVLDDVSGAPITHALVRYKWFINWIPYMIDAVHISNGVYGFSISNSLPSFYYIGAVATGYISDNRENKLLPATLRMKPGRTVRMYGTVYDGDGMVVSGAYIAARPLPENVWTNDEWSQTYSCETYADEKGRYEIPTLPLDLTGLFPRFCHGNMPMLDLTNYVFDTCNGDIALDIKLPAYVQVRGRVKWNTGAPVTNATVWLGASDEEQEASWTSMSGLLYGVRGSRTKTDENGMFVIRSLNTKRYFHVKASLDGRPESRPAACSSLYGLNMPPPPMVELVISGTRLCGRITDTAGRPVTNAVLYERGEIPVDIQPDGSYLTEVIQPGAYDISCTAPGYQPTQRTVAVRQGSIELCDFTLEPNATYTGRVLDWATKQPVPDVLITARENMTGFPMRTGVDGIFRVQPDAYLALTFSHPEYATTALLIAEYLNVSTNLDVFMSADTRLKVHIDGIPSMYTKPLSVRLQSFSTWSRSSWSSGSMPGDSCMLAATVVDGVAEFTQIPAGTLPWLVILCMGTATEQMPLGTGRKIDIEPGTATETRLAMPPFGALAVTLSVPFNQRTHNVNIAERGAGKENEEGIPLFLGTYWGCDINGRRLLWSCILTNTYQVSVNTAGSTFDTNIVIAANHTAELFVDVPTNAPNDGVIRGTVKLADGFPLNGSVTVRLLDSYNPGYGQVRDGAFLIGGLESASNYQVNVQIESYSRTNLTASGVKPNGPPLEFVLDGAYRVTGSVVDQDGTPLRFSLGASEWSADRQQLGELVLYPMFPGPHTIWIAAQGYAPCKVEARVVSADVDLGNIVVVDKGCRLSGRLVNEQGAPVANTDIQLQGRESDFGRSGKTDADGRFVFENTARDVPLSLGVSGYYQTTELEPLTQDKDIGDMTLR